MCSDWHTRSTVFTSGALQMRLTRNDNLVQRKVAVFIGDLGDNDKMWTFLKEVLLFDAVVRGDCSTPD
jgi:hypothetical protein